MPHLDRYRRVFGLDGTALFTRGLKSDGARRWVKDAVQDVKDGIPFPMRGIDSDNGGGFISRQLIGWCAENSVRFTRGRPCRKNGNCFVEQKNGDRVRKTIGCRRFGTEAESSTKLTQPPPPGSTASPAR